MSLYANYCKKLFTCVVFLQVKIFDLSFDSCPKSYVFSGMYDVDSKKFPHLLGIRGDSLMNYDQGGSTSSPSYRFILPLSQCQLTLENIVEGLSPDSWPPKKHSRSLRSFGVAISLAVSLLEHLRCHCAARILTFLGGPCTLGPGKVADPSLKIPMRSNFDIEKDYAQYVQDAMRFYGTQAQRVAENGHIVDIFAGSLDQVGILEMRQLVQKTGGHLVNAESFSHSVFKDTLRKIFARDGNGKLNMGFQVTMQISTTKELRILGAIGHLNSMKRASSSVSVRTIGESETYVWKTCGMDPRSTYGFYFSNVDQDQIPRRKQLGLIQISTTYVDSCGAHILRVTTLGRPFVGTTASETMMDATDPKTALSVGFDQEAATVLMTRMAVNKVLSESPVDVIRWIDRTLISITKNFGEYLQNDTTSFRLGRHFGLFPQFVFHLRRSNLFQKFNSSPDESTYYRHLLLRETCTNSITIIQPRLEAYTFENKGFPVLLSSTSLAPDRILLLDMYFTVLIWHGKVISEWKGKGYQNDSNYGSFRDLLNSPVEDANAILEERIPTPSLKSCAYDHGDARYLLAVIDPAQTYGLSNFGQNGGEVIPTDDANLQVFIEHLTKLVVQNP